MKIRDALKTEHTRKTCDCEYNVNISRQMRSHAEIKSRAISTLRDADVWGIVPVPLETIAYGLGFKVVNFDGRDDISGAIDHGRSTIFINSGDSLVRQRFTLAHEIGHAVLHEAVDKVDYRSNFSAPGDYKEREANQFASELLMPTELFRSAWQERRDTFRMAAYFAVSHEAATYKAKNLGLII